MKYLPTIFGIIIIIAAVAYRFVGAAGQWFIKIYLGSLVAFTIAIYLFKLFMKSLMP
jgi:hypothetical protein